jgi:16S rRNA (guanine966-N2)-methyltransferase
MRITGGIYRSRLLRAPRGRETRPTSDRVREALFGMLEAAGAIRGARVLDLYAGTGSLACEAMSRGAVHATLVESAREALGVLRQNLASLGLERQTTVLAVDVARAGKRLAAAGPFDLVLADPPWDLVGSGEAPRAIAEAIAATALSDGARVVLEHSARTEAPLMGGLALEDARRYGDTALAIYKPAILAPPCPPAARTPPP